MTPRLVLCLIACSFRWVPLALVESVRRMYLGWVGCLAYSALVVALCLLVLLPTEQRR